MDDGDAETPDVDTLYERVVRGDLGPRFPLATYRVQLNHELTFADVGARVDYLYALGISDVYTSPFFKARPGSTHGYDLVDHNALNPEIGTREDLGRLHARLAALDMGLLLDFVPNHMGIGTGDNAWWMDVLENGESSVYAPFFDIDWKPLKTELAGKVLLPLLGDHYGRVLENGELRLEFDGGGFFVRFGATRFPVNPRTYPLVLTRLVPPLVSLFGEEHDAVLELMSIITGLTHLPARTVTQRARIIERRREKEILKRRLAALTADVPSVASALDAELDRLNGDRADPRSFDALETLLEEQCYRLSYWRTAAEEINYRRFFDINDLAAIHMERPAVFSEAHRLLFELVAEGWVTGVRIDHPDGLWDPGRYFARLQRVVFFERCQRALAEQDGPLAAANMAALMRRFDEESAGHPNGARPEGAEPTVPPRPLYVVVEKILARDEELPRDWAVHGTSGYDFATLVGAVFVDTQSEAAMTATYERFTGTVVDFATLMYEKKKLILLTSLASELNVLAHALSVLSERDRHTRDFTLGTVTAALRETIACFPVYRTYIDEATVAAAPRDRAAVAVAVRLARRRNPAMDASVYDFVRSILLLDVPATVAEANRPLYRDFVMRFQQLTGPVMAKGLEDTAFYVYTRLSSLNEVGGEPERFGSSIGELHETNDERLQHFPYSLLATSTHDTKRSEDVRARISVLSEIPDAWSGAVFRMAAATAHLSREIDEVDGADGFRGLKAKRAPDRNDEYLFYQTLLGVWPDGASEAPGDLVERLVAYMRKATKEAKVNTSWINADPEYDAAVESFVRAVPALPAFLDAFLPLSRTVAYHGMWGSLSQTLLKLTSPGVPDIYQGNEIWAYRLVDPDNRQEVDYAVRAKMLAEVRARKGEGRGYVSELVARAADGTIKLFVTHVALDARRTAPELFGASSTYTALYAAGAGRDHVIAFARSSSPAREVPRASDRDEGADRGGDRGDAELVVVAPRFTAKLAGGKLEPPLGAVWADTVIPVSAGRYTNLFTGEVVETEARAETAVLRLDRALADVPVALLVR